MKQADEQLLALRAELFRVVENDRDAKVGLMYALSLTTHPTSGEDSADAYKRVKEVEDDVYKYGCRMVKKVGVTVPICASDLMYWFSEFNAIVRVVRDRTDAPYETAQLMMQFQPVLLQIMHATASGKINPYDPIENGIPGGEAMVTVLRNYVLAYRNKFVPHYNSNYEKVLNRLIGVSPAVH